jgi:L-histidine N-alpha-methyltransferase
VTSENTATVLSPDALEAMHRRREMLREVCVGLSRTPKELPPKFFYDARGSRLFEEITRLPEYYLTRAEREILFERAAEIAAAVRPRTLVELGAGSAAKTRILLSAIRNIESNIVYVPVDVSAGFLDETAQALVGEYPGLAVRPVVADITRGLPLPEERPSPTLVALLGSTIGNFDTPDAMVLLRRVRAFMRPGDRFLLGADLRKDPAVLEAAYNDAQGVTAQFNLNMLRVLNNELGADFVPGRFAHRAVYDAGAHRIEMYLDSLVRQDVHIPGIAMVSLREGEPIRTEISCKYDRASVDALSASAGLVVHEWYTDGAERFALAVIASRA